MQKDVTLEGILEMKTIRVLAAFLTLGSVGSDAGGGRILRSHERF